MSSYTKLFSHIITSSVWSEDDQTRILWITFLALSDKYGEVMASIPGLAKVSNLSIESVKRGIQNLSDPDEYSRTPDDEGRRITQIPGGWHIINYEKHRKMASLDEQRAKATERQRRWRERQKRNGSVTKSDGLSHHRNAVLTHEPDRADADADVLRNKTRARTQTELVDFVVSLGLPKSDGESLWLKWEENGWTNDGRPIKNWKLTIQRWKLDGIMPSQKRQRKFNPIKPNVSDKPSDRL